MTNFLICQELPEPRRVESLWNLGLALPVEIGCVARNPATAKGSMPRFRQPPSPSWASL